MKSHSGAEQYERVSRALAVLYNISVACRGQTAFRPIFEVIVAEMRALYEFDACYIAVCDQERPGFFRAALLIDEDLVEYEENTDYGVMTGALLSRQKPMLFRDLASEREVFGSRPMPFGDIAKVSRSWMGVPLLLGRDAVGVISLQSYRAGIYDDADLDLLQHVGNLAAVVLENATLGQSHKALSTALADQVAARTRELNALGELAAEMVRGRPLDDLLAQALDLLTALFGFEAAIIRQIEGDGNLRLLAQRGMPEDYIERHAVIPMAGTLLGRVIAENRTLAVGTEYALGLRDRGLHYQSILSVPLRIGDHILGGMSLLTVAPRRFSQAEIDVALALANQIALAIENTRLVVERERRVAELTALGVIARAASTALNPQMLLRQVYNALSDILPLDAFSMVVYDPERKIITDGISIDEGAEYGYWKRMPPPRDSLTAWVLQEAQPLRFNNIAAEIEAYPELAQRHVIGSGRHAVSWLGVPLISRAGSSIGVIIVQGYRPAMFSERDQSFLISIAGQVALHVQNVALLARRERQIRELDAIDRISREVSAALSLEAMHKPVYQTLQPITGASSFFLIIVEVSDHRFRHAYYIDGGEEITHEWPGGRPPEGSLTSWILDNAAPLLFDDIHTQTEQLNAVGVQPKIYGSDDRPRSWVGVPLLDAEGRPVGVLALQDSRPYQYDRQTIEFLSQVASHISLGIQKIALFEAERTARRTADTLREVARVLNSTFDPDEVLEIFLHELNQVIPHDTASIMLLERQGLRVVAMRGWEIENTPRGVVFPLDKENAAVRVVRERTPMLLSDTTSASNWLRTAWNEEINSWLGIPLVVKGRVLGVLNIDSRQRNRFTARDLEVALAFANQASVSLENARLYAESVTRVEEELAIARQIQSNLFPRELPNIVGLDVAARCLPARETGGDFYDCFRLEGQGGTPLALMVGDASGKSIPGAMLMAVARSVARSEARDHIEPAAVMRETNQLMALDIPRGSFVALSYATIDSDCRCLALANAGQLAPLLRKPDGSIEYLQPEGPAFPLGIAPAIAYVALEITLDHGDTLVFYTDGVVEAHNPARQMFGFERLERMVRDHGQIAPAELVELVLRAVSDFMGTAPQHDDMTVMVVRIT